MEVNFYHKENCFLPALCAKLTLVTWAITLIEMTMVELCWKVTISPLKLGEIRYFHLKSYNNNQLE